MRARMFTAAPAHKCGKRISRGIPRPQDKWDVLIHDHRKGYISWNDYERDQGIVNGNANMKGAMVKGSVRKGGGVLAGLLRCERCGRKVNVLHNNTDGSARYVCRGARVNHRHRANCISFSNLRIDAAVSREVFLSVDYSHETSMRVNRPV